MGFRSHAQVIRCLFFAGSLSLWRRACLACHVGDQKNQKKKIKRSLSPPPHLSLSLSPRRHRPRRWPLASGEACTTVMIPMAVVRRPDYPTKKPKLGWKIPPPPLPRRRRQESSIPRRWPWGGWGGAEMKGKNQRHVLSCVQVLVRYKVSNSSRVLGMLGRVGIPWRVRDHVSVNSEDADHGAGRKGRVSADGSFRPAPIAIRFRPPPQDGYLETRSDMNVQSVPASPCSIARWRYWAAAVHVPPAHSTTLAAHPHLSRFRQAQARCKGGHREDACVAWRLATFFGACRSIDCGRGERAIPRGAMSERRPANLLAPPAPRRAMLSPRGFIVPKPSPTVQGRRIALTYHGGEEAAQSHGNSHTHKLRLLPPRPDRASWDNVCATRARLTSHRANQNS